MSGTLASGVWRHLVTDLPERWRAARRAGSHVFGGIKARSWSQAARDLAAWGRRRPRIAGSLAVALLLLTVALARITRGGADAELPTAPVRRGPFRVTVVETGTLQALRSVSYASAIQSNQAKIVAIAPEGKLVQKGDLLILFDAAPFEEEIRRSQAQLSQAEADLLKARQDLRLQQIQNQEELATARQKLERSDLELKDVQEGQGRLKEEEAAAVVAAAQRELTKAETAHEDLKPLLAQGFITKIELERAEQGVQKAREDLALAERRHDALLRFARPLELSQARADAALNRDSIKQLESAAAYRLDAKRAAIASAESRIQEASSKLTQARQQLARTEVRADVPGIVVYRPVFFGSEHRKPQVGDQVWANQPLLILPDVSRMVVETRVRETDIHKLEQDQDVTLRVDAYPDLKLTGKVTLLGTLAQEERERRGAKYFGVTIQVNESEPRLRPGMTARVEIEVETRKDALSVPLDAVFDEGGRSLCYVSGRGGVEAVEVVTGPSNADFVVIERGLREGQHVSLRGPNVASAER